MRFNCLTSLLYILLISIYAIPSATAQEQPFTGQVISVSDGDTIKVLHDGIPEKIRLSGIDCPEKTQAFGSVAKRLTSELCFGKPVGIIPVDHDRYGRTVAQVILPDGRVLNSELVRHGYAWWYQKYSPFDRELQQLEATARVNHDGLWSAANPIAPWDFRHNGGRNSTKQESAFRPF